MQWKAKSLPTDGQRRVIRRFALWPSLMSDGNTVVWLERFEITQEWVFWFGSHSDGHWRDRLSSALRPLEGA